MTCWMRLGSAKIIGQGRLFFTFVLTPKQITICDKILIARVCSTCEADNIAMHTQLSILTSKEIQALIKLNKIFFKIFLSTLHSKCFCFV